MKKRRLTFDEMKAQFPDEWIFVANPKMDEYGKVISGVVLFHHADQRKFFEESGNHREGFKHFTNTYTGILEDKPRPWLRAIRLN